MISPTQETTSRRQGGIWEYVSPSRLALWAKCPLAFKFRYIDCVKTPTSPAMFLGHCVHSGLENFYRHRQLGVTKESQDVVARMRVDWDQAVADDEMKFDSADQETRLQQQAAALVTAYIEQVPSDEQRPRFVEATMESRLIDPATGEEIGLPLVGIVDLVLEGSDGPTIVDFKTAARGGELLAITHEVQLTAYSYAHRQLTGERESGLQIRRLIKTKSPKIETHEFAPRTDRDFARFFALVRAYLADLHRGESTFRPGWHCSMCDFRDRQCRAWCG